MLARFSNDGHIAVAKDNVISLINSTGQTVAAGAHMASVNDLAFSNNLLFSCSDDKTCQVWEYICMRQCGVFAGHTAPVTSVALNHKGNLLLTTSQDESFRLWCVRDRSCIRKLGVHHDTVVSARFSPDGSIILSASQDGRVRLWDAHSGVCLRTLYSDGVGTPFTNAAFVPNGHYFLASSANGLTRLWDIEGLVLRKAYNSEVEDFVKRDFCFLEGFLLVATKEGIRVFDYQKQTCLGVLDLPGALSIDVNRVNKCVLGAGAQTLKIWPIEVIRGLG